MHSGINRGMFLRQLNNDADPADSFNSNYGFFTCIRTCNIIELAIVYVCVRERESLHGLQSQMLETRNWVLSHFMLGSWELGMICMIMNLVYFSYCPRWKKGKKKQMRIPDTI